MSRTSGEVSLGEVRAHVFGSPVNPDAMELGTFDQVSIAVDTRPVAYALHQTLLTEFERIYRILSSWAASSKATDA